jgi:iron complex transport system ATP-binding protein
MNTDVLETRGLSTGYASRSLHSALDLRVNAGQLVCLIGPNGSGKTTLLRTLSGSQRPIAGQVLLSGRDVHRLSSLERARHLSIVTTERIASGLITGYELVAMGRIPHTSWTGALSVKDHDIVERAIRQCRAADLSGRPLAEISDGERQRLMLARALAQEPRLLVLDEITAFLDVTKRIEMAILLRKIARETGVAILLSTHDLDLALRTADRVWLLPGPGLFNQGIPEELVLDGTLASAFAAEGVLFDRESGGFVLTESAAHLTPVSGSGVNATWARRAVARLGLAEPDMMIAVEEGEFRVLRHGMGTSSSTLTGLLELIARRGT